MPSTDISFTGNIPEIYDTHMVPLIFDYYANDLAARVSAFQPRSLLEIAAGSGVVTRALASRLPAGARYVATDLNPAMLARAQSMQPAPDSVKWQQADAMALPFDDATFEAVICQFGVMFYPDRGAGHAETRRVLAEGGHYLFSVWGRIENNEMAKAVTDAAAEIFPDDPPDFMARIPHGYFDKALIERDLRAGGFDDFSIETMETTSRAPSAQFAAIAYCQGTPMRHEIEKRDPERMTAMIDLSSRLIVERHGDKPVDTRIEAHVISARK